MQRFVRGLGRCEILVNVLCCNVPDDYREGTLHKVFPDRQAQLVFRMAVSCLCERLVFACVRVAVRVYIVPLGLVGQCNL